MTHHHEKPISEISRHELERELVKAMRTIQRLRDECCRESIAHLRTLAEMRKVPLKRLGLNYLWGLANFTLGCVLCGSLVAAILIGSGQVK